MITMEHRFIVKASRQEVPSFVHDMNQELLLVLC
jgi:hypothetical protein